MRVIWSTSSAFAITSLLTALVPFAATPQQVARAQAIRPAVASPHRHYAGLHEHFVAANSTHDGKLTAAQARQVGWNRLVLHFDEIDTQHLGYVTEAQIHAFKQAHRHGRRSGAES